MHYKWKNRGRREGSLSCTSVLIISQTMEVARVSFDCNDALNWATRDPSGNGTVFKDHFSMGHSLYERVFEQNGTRFEMVLNNSEPDPDVNEHWRIQTMLDGKADLSFALFGFTLKRSALVDLMFPVTVSFWPNTELF